MQHRIIEVKQDGKTRYAIQRKEFLFGWMFYNTDPLVKGWHKTLKESKKELSRITSSPIIKVVG